MRWSGFAVVLIVAPLAVAEETPREFLRALWAEGLTDQALRYIDKLDAQDNTPPQLRAELGYLRGLTKLASARDAKLPAAKRKTALNEAHQAIRAFLTEHPRHENNVEARQQLASVLVEAARLLTAEAERDMDVVEKERALKESRQRYAQAVTELNGLKEQIQERLVQLPRVIPPVARAARLAERDKLRSRYIEVQIIAAVCQMESAKTFRDAGQRNAGLKEAANAWGEIYEKYRRRLAGLYALLHQGKCYEEMGEHDEALAYYQELLEQPIDGRPFRDLRTKVVVRVMACANAKGDPQAAIKRGKSWLATVLPEEEKQDDWLELQLELARAHVQQADRDEEEKAEHLAAAELLAKNVIAAQGEHAGAARRLLAEIDPEKPAPMDEDPVSFNEAVRKGRDALQRYQAATVQSMDLRTKLDTENSPTKKTELLKQLEAAETTSQDALTDARRNFERGLALPLDEVRSKDENRARYLLAYVYHHQQRYREAIDAATPILKRTLEDLSAQPAARIILGSRVALWNGTQKTMLRNEHGNAIIALEDLIRRTWPESLLAETARTAAERVKATIPSASVEE